MNVDETAIYEFLKRMPGHFRSAQDVSHGAGPRKRYLTDRLWALPLLRRMEFEGLLETNLMGEFRLRPHAEDTATFYKALEQPGSALGDTAIITLDDLAEDLHPTGT